MLCRTLYPRLTFALWKQICGKFIIIIVATRSLHSVYILAQSSSVVVGPFALRGTYQQGMQVNPKFAPVISTTSNSEVYGLLKRFTPYVYAAMLRQNSNSVESMNMRNKIAKISDNFDLDENASDADLLDKLIGERQKIPNGDAEERDVEHDLTNPLYLI